MSKVPQLFIILNSILCHDNFTMETQVVNIDEWDSLNHLRIVLELNKEFSLNLDPSDIHSSDTLKIVNELLKR